MRLSCPPGPTPESWSHPRGVAYASVAIDGFANRVGPTSTVKGAAALNAIVAEAAERLVLRGIDPDVFLSSNVEGGDDVNSRLLHGEDGR